MKSIEIKGSLRTDLGKKGTRELRKSNGVPCVLYGVKKGENGLPVATHFSVTVDGLRKLVYTPNIYLVNLDIDGEVVTAIMKDIQFHPVKDNILHVDFLQAEENKPVIMEVPAGLKAEQVSNTEITISGIDKQKVTEFAANVRSVREPEPYKGKGIRYKGEYVRRKEGKKAAK